MLLRNLCSHSPEIAIELALKKCSVVQGLHVKASTAYDQQIMFLDASVIQRLKCDTKTEMFTSHVEFGHFNLKKLYFLEQVQDIS